MPSRLKIAASESKRVLLIEDDFSMETSLTAAIRQMNPETDIEWVSQAEDALKKLGHQARLRGDRPYDLVVCDVFLDGEISGLDLWLHCFSIYSGMPVVLISGLATYKFLEILKNRNIDPVFFDKPIDFRRFQEVTAPWLGVGTNFEMSQQESPR